MGFVQYMFSQFSRPRGVLGYVADYMMSHRPENIERNNWALSLLAIKPADRILEIGFGPGITAGKLATKAAEVVGVDHSELMVRQATRRNKDLIEKGKLKLMQGSVEKLSPEFGSFDKIYSMNVVQFWTEPVSVFRSLKTLLKPGGMILTGYMPRFPGAKDEDAVRKAKEVENWLRESGFEQARTQIKPMKPVAVVAIMAIQA